MSFESYYKEAFRFFYNEEINTVDVTVEEYEVKDISSLEGIARVKQYAINQTVKESKQSMEGLIHDLNIMNSRSGNQVPFSSINFGTDFSPEGRCVIRTFLEAVDDGVGNEHKTAIFPISIFKVKSGINRNPEDKNYDLFKLAQKVTSKRFFPNFINLDTEFNQNEKWNINDPNRWYYEPSTMGCRTRVYENRHGEKSSVGRGNASFTSINIVRVALKAMTKTESLEDRIDVLASAGFPFSDIVTTATLSRRKSQTFLPMSKPLSTVLIAASAVWIQPSTVSFADGTIAD